MTDPRPLAGTDLAPCPWCGGDLTARVRDDGDGQWWFIACSDGDWGHDVDSLDAYTLATAPWTRGVWAEVAELRLVLAAEQGRAEGAPSSEWEWDAHARGWARLSDTMGWISVDYRGGGTWYADRHPGGTAPNLRAAMQAADEAEAAAAKEPTP